MCGRFNQHLPASQQWAALLEDWPAQCFSSEEIRPTDMAGTIDAQGFRMRSWWLVPRWSKTISANSRYPTFNARAETLMAKPSFRDAWRHSQRCIVPAAAYYEWTGPRGGKRRHTIAREDGEVMLLAGLWECCTVGGETVDTFTVITTSAPQSLAWLHPRAPLYLVDGAEADCWLHGAPDEASNLLRASPDGFMTVTPAMGHEGSIAPEN